MKTRVAINGFGRVGRLTFRNMFSRTDEFEIVAINDRGKPSQLAQLLKYDTTQGPFSHDVVWDPQHLIVADVAIPVLQIEDPGALPWDRYDVNVAFESTGVFRKRSSKARAGYDSHLTAGADRVVLSAPASDDPDQTIVCGVNDGRLRITDRLVSNASCTTNCLAPMAKVLHEAFRVIKGQMVTVHAYTSDQRIVDLLHEDPYRARSGPANIIPATTGAADAIGKVLPELDGKLTGMAMRVPVPCGSATALTVLVEETVSVNQVNDALREAVADALRGILQYNSDPIVSSDIVGNPHSCIFDANWTSVIGGNLVKVIGWYDNEWGYSCRCADLIRLVGSLG